MKSDQNNQHHRIILLFVILLIVALEAIFFFAEESKIKEQEKTKIEQSAAEQATLDQVPMLAKAVSVYDVDANTKIYGRNDDVALPIASLAKIMTVVVALNHHKPGDELIISSNAIKQSGDYGLLVGERWNIYDLAKLTLINSVNDGAYAIAIPIDVNPSNAENFISEMNLKAKKIGATSTTFLNVTGLDFDDHTVGAFASANDVNIMAMYAIRDYPEVFGATTMKEINLTSATGTHHRFLNTDLIIDKIPNILFSKTGYTDSAGGNLCIIFRTSGGRKIAVTLLGSTIDGRFVDMERIVNVLYNF